MGIESFDVINDEAYKDGNRYDLVFLGEKSYLVFDPDNVYVVLNIIGNSINGVQIVDPSKLEKILDKYYSLF